LKGYSHCGLLLIFTSKFLVSGHQKEHRTPQKKWGFGRQSKNCQTHLKLETASTPLFTHQVFATAFWDDRRANNLCCFMYQKHYFNHWQGEE